jgi:hypothetical protein
MHVGLQKQKGGETHVINTLEIWDMRMVHTFETWEPIRHSTGCFWDTLFLHVGSLGFWKEERTFGPIGMQSIIEHQ